MLRVAHEMPSAEMRVEIENHPKTDDVCAHTAH